MARGDRNYLEKHYGSRFVEYAGKAALAEARGVTGGYTVPPEFYQQLMSIMAEETFIRPRAFVVPMASATMQIPYLDVSTVQSAGVSRSSAACRCTGRPRRRRAPRRSRSSSKWN